MHLYNVWLPPPLAKETKKEKQSFSRVVSSVKDLYRSDDPESVYFTLKWISVIELFIKAKSDISLEDVATLLEMGLEIFHKSENKLYVQVRWGNILVWTEVFDWWDVELDMLGSIIHWFQAIHVWLTNDKVPVVWSLLCIIIAWHIWGVHNNLIFRVVEHLDEIVESIKVKSFFWMKDRSQ